MNRKQLIREKCANYKDGFCLIRDIECPLVTPFEYHGKHFPCNEVECGYFEIFVLGNKGDMKENISTVGNTNTKAIELASTHEMVFYSYKSCKRCEKQFRPTSRGNRYCSVSCKEAGRKQTYREANARRK